ncbi:MAG: hypoxanthine phosphoribosyltransferase [Gemmatimonadota bacterium]
MVSRSSSAESAGAATAVAEGPGAAEVLERTGGRELARIVYSERDISERVEAMGRAITDAYPCDEELLILGLLKGSFIFVGDLVRAIRRPVQVDFLVASSYGSGTTTSGEVKLLYDPSAPVEGRHVVLVEDIVDSGTTVNRMARALGERRPASLEICALLHKHLARDLALEPRWVGFDAPPEFLVGYGLDHAEDFRHLPFVASL